MSLISVNVETSTVGNIIVPSTFSSDLIRIHYSGGRSTCVAVEPVDLANPTTTTTSIPDNNVTLLNNSHVSVPSGFCGINAGTSGSNSWFNLQPYNFGLVRTWDTGICWQSLNPSNGVYTWSTLDTFVDTYSSYCDIIFTVAITPAWASARPTEPDPAYGLLGSRAEPANMSYLAAFITAVATRYGNKIKYYEIWSEPSWVHSDGSALSSSDQNTLAGGTFFSGTMAALAQITKTVNQAAKAVYAAAKIISSPMTGWGEIGYIYTPYFQFYYMMTASDGGSGTMATWVDVVGSHLYCDEYDSLLFLAITNVKAAMTQAGVSTLPIMNSEFGIILGPNEYGVVYNDLTYYQCLSRQYIVCAALGLVGCCMYMIGEPSVSTRMSLSSRPNVLSALGALLLLIQTYGITSSGVMSDGRVYAMINSQVYIF